LPGISIRLALLMITGLFVWPAFAHAFEVWSTTQEFSYGFLVPPISVLLVWWRWREVGKTAGRGAWMGLPIVVGAVALALFGHRAAINAIIGLAVIPLLWGMAIFLWGWSAARILAFPIGFLAFGLGLYRGLLGSVGFALQEVTAAGAGTLGAGLGLPVVRDGLVLRGERFAFIVAEACSGMGSLLSLLALAALWIYLAGGSWRARLAVLLSVAPLVIVANITRVTLVLVVASWFGAEAALGFFHGASSLVLFGIALAGLLLVSWVAGCKTPRFAISS
jgi:exosortase